MKTALYDMHLSLGGKMVPFAGYELPVQYDGLGVMKEHKHTRDEKCASLFDVSHMGQIHWHGKDATSFLERMVCGDIASMKPGEGKLSLIMQETGGIMDDTVISNAGDYIHMVVNGACKMKDMAHFQHYLDAEFRGADVQMEYLADQQLLALQGPGAAIALQRQAPELELSKMPFMATCLTTIAGVPNCRLTRCGYTGEDGFEVSASHGAAPALAEALLAQPEVEPAGLGARDSLRLEAGLCLYGNDIDEGTNPVEAALAWTLGGPAGRRRQDQRFLGAKTFLTEEGKLKKVLRKRVGIAGMKIPARAGVEIFAENGSEPVGSITSGCPAPTLGSPVAMGYVSADLAKVGTAVQLKVRGKMVPATVTKMPFVEPRYFRGA